MRKIIVILIISLFTVCYLHSQEGNVAFFTIDSCVAYALENSPYLHSRKQNVFLGEKELQIKKGLRYPVVSANANYYLTNQYANLNEAFLPGVDVEYAGSGAGIELTQPIWQNNKINLLIDKMEIGLQVSKEQYKSEYNNLIYNVKCQYVDFLRKLLLEELSRKMSERISVYVESANERYKVGAARKSDILKSETQLSNSIYMVSKYEAGKKIAECKLMKTIGMDLSYAIQVANIFDTVNYGNLNSTLDDFYQVAEENLPELKVVQNMIEGQSLSIKLEKKSNGPELGLYANYGWSQTPFPLQDDALYGSVGATLNFKIFEGFSKKQRVARETIKMEQLRYDSTDLKQTIKFEIREAYLTLFEARDQITNSLKQLENSSVNLQIVQEEYKEGVSSMLELLDAENADFVANQNYINAVSVFQIANYTLERKSGILTTNINE